MRQTWYLACLACKAQWDIPYTPSILLAVDPVEAPEVCVQCGRRGFIHVENVEPDYLEGGE